MEAWILSSLHRSSLRRRRITPEQQVADILPIEADPGEAERALAEVPFWFHTFALITRTASTRRASLSTTATGSPPAGGLLEA